MSDHIHALPFTLKETKEFLEAKKMKLSNQELVKLYMTFGRVPYYSK